MRGLRAHSGRKQLPKFTIVVPAYNAEATLAETLDAVIAQTTTDWDCVVVDDGSTDGTLALARSFAARVPHMRVITQENRGTGGAYNAGVGAATGEWVTVCSADDVLLPGLLESVGRTVAQEPDADIVSCNGYYWYPDDSRSLVYCTGSQTSWSLETLFERCFFSVGACFKREWFDAVGGYREDIYGEDYDFWLRAIAAGANHVYLDEPLALHRISDTQKTASLERAYESDIRSIEAVVESGGLTQRQRDAARRAVAHRRRLIAESRRPDSLFTIFRRLLRRLVTGAPSR